MTQNSSARRMLLPLTPLYRLALSLRELRLRSGLEPVRRLRFPVVSIGSLSAGGSGKTPLTIALAQALTRRGIRVDVLSRGYGRRSHAALRVNPKGAAEDFGDEPLLIARDSGVPVYVAAQRFEAGSMAEAALPEPKVPFVHLLDDGFQHRPVQPSSRFLPTTEKWKRSSRPQAGKAQSGAFGDASKCRPLTALLWPSAASRAATSSLPDSNQPASIWHPESPLRTITSTKFTISIASRTQRAAPALGRSSQRRRTGFVWARWASLFRSKLPPCISRSRTRKRQLMGS